MWTIFSITCGVESPLLYLTNLLCCSCQTLLSTATNLVQSVMHDCCNIANWLFIYYSYRFARPARVSIVTANLFFLVYFLPKGISWQNRWVMEDIWSLRWNFTRISKGLFTVMTEFRVTRARARQKSRGRMRCEFFTAVSICSVHHTYNDMLSLNVLQTFALVLFSALPSVPRSLYKYKRIIVTWTE